MMQIQLVPNSGHHFYWAPFDSEVLRSLPAATRESLEEKCQRNPVATRDLQRWAAYGLGAVQVFDGIRGCE